MVIIRPCYMLTEYVKCRGQLEYTVPRNLSSISVETLAIAAACQALDDGLPYE